MLKQYNWKYIIYMGLLIQERLKTLKEHTISIYNNIWQSDITFIGY